MRELLAPFITLLFNRSLVTGCFPSDFKHVRPLLKKNGLDASDLKLNMDKMELLCAGTRYNMLMLNDSGPSLQLNNVTVNASQHVRVLGVHLSSDLSLDKMLNDYGPSLHHHHIIIIIIVHL